MRKALLFDFDGTLANTLPVITEILVRRAQEFGLPPERGEKIRTMKDAGLNDIIQASDLSVFKLAFIVKECQRELYESMPCISVAHKSLPRTLRSLKSKGYILGVITSNTKENVERFLSKKKFNLFDFVYSGRSLFGKGRVIRCALKIHRLNPKLAFYIGDETRDVEAARQAGITSVAVSWGFNSTNVLLAHNPDFLVRSPQELLRAVNDS